MAIDPRIALGVQGIQLPDFAGAYQNIIDNRYKRQAMQQNTDLHNAQMEEIRRKKAAQNEAAARGAQVRETLGRGGKSADVMALDPELGMKMAEDERKAQQFDADMKIKELTQAEQRAKAIGSLASAANPDNYQLIVDMGVKLGLPPEIADRVKASPWNDQTANLFKTFADSSMSAAEQAAKARADIELGIKKAQEDRAKELFPAQRTKAENEAVTTTPNAQGLTPAQAAQQKSAEQDRALREREGAASRAVTVRGQNMTDSRQREMTEISRENKPLAEYETRNYGFYRRAGDAESILNGMESAVQSKGVAGQAFQKFAPNVIQTQENQAYEQAKRQFLAAYLRRDSGAVITPSEIEEGDRTFFAQPGDKPAVIEQKRKARQTVMKALQVGAGRAVEKIDGASQQPQSPKVGQIEDGYVFLGGNPADKKNWKKQ